MELSLYAFDAFIYGYIGKNQMLADFVFTENCCAALHCAAQQRAALRGAEKGSVAQPMTVWTYLCKSVASNVWGSWSQKGAYAVLGFNNNRARVSFKC